MFTTVYFLPLKDKQDELITGKSVEKGMIFYRQRQKCRLILTVKLHGISNSFQM